MAMSPPVFLGDAAWLAAKRSGAPLVFNLQDIFPDIAVELGALSGERVLALARRHERSLYRRADAITVLSEDQAKNVRKKLPAQNPPKLEVIRNFVDLDRIRPVERENEYRRRHGLMDKTVVMYSGNVGLSQSFDLVQSAALKWARDRSVAFVINGEGAGRPAVDAWAESMPNVTVVNFGPRAQIQSILGAADLHLVVLKAGLAQSSTPSKLYSIMAAGRPVLASIDEGSEVSEVITKHNIGLAVPPDDEWSFCRGLEQLLESPDELLAMGERGRAVAETWLTPEAQAEAYEQLFIQLLGR